MVKLEGLKYIEGVGRRKTSTARVRIYEGKPDIRVVLKDGTEVEMSKYFDRQYWITRIIEPLQVTNMLKKFGFSVVVKGGGKTGQADAIRLGLARALVKYDESLKPVLKAKKMLTRDPRMVERKKYYLRKARRAPQYSKR